jgi:hypothetical protein
MGIKNLNGALITRNKITSKYSVRARERRLESSLNLGFSLPAERGVSPPPLASSLPLINILLFNGIAPAWPLNAAPHPLLGGVSPPDVVTGCFHPWRRVLCGRWQLRGPPSRRLRAPREQVVPHRDMPYTKYLRSCCAPKATLLL